MGRWSAGRRLAAMAVRRRGAVEGLGGEYHETAASRASSTTTTPQLGTGSRRRPDTSSELVDLFHYTGMAFVRGQTVSPSAITALERRTCKRRWAANSAETQGTSAVSSSISHTMPSSQRATSHKHAGRADSSITNFIFVGASTRPARPRKRASKNCVGEAPEGDSTPAYSA